MKVLDISKNKERVFTQTFGEIYKAQREAKEVAAAKGKKARGNKK